MIAFPVGEASSSTPLPEAKSLTLWHAQFTEVLLNVWTWILIFSWAESPQWMLWLFFTVKWKTGTFSPLRFLDLQLRDTHSWAVNCGSRLWSLIKLWGSLILVDHSAYPHSPLCSPVCHCLTFYGSHPITIAIVSISNIEAPGLCHFWNWEAIWETS